MGVFADVALAVVVAGVALYVLVVLGVMFLMWLARRERYGPPPGNYRAMAEAELGSRGWPTQPKPYHATTASAISNWVERTA